MKSLIFASSRKSEEAIAEELGCSKTAVLEALRRFNIPRRNNKEAQDIWWNKHRREVTYKVTESGCWECTSHHNRVRGYPEIRINGKKMRLSRYIYSKHHHISLESMQGLVVMHTCDNPKCINPNHLKLGTDYDNMQDRNKKMRQMHGEGHYRATLTEDDVRAIRKSNKTSIELGKLYGVAHATIRNVRLRRSWRYVND